MKKYFFFLLIINISFYKCFSQTSPDSLRYKTNPNYIQEMGLYEVYNLKQANIVMLGNSITHGVNWNELLGRSDIVERGVPSDVVEGYRSRLKYIFNLNPKACFIMGGINDIYSWTPVDTVFASYVKLIKEIQAKNIIVVIQSTLYVTAAYNYAADRNNEVEKLDKMLADYAARNNIIFIDLNSRLSFRKALIGDLSFDGVHLNGKAYKIWGKEVEKVLSKLGM